MKSREYTIVRAIFGFSLGCSLLLVGIRTIQHPNWIQFLVALAVATGMAYWVINWLQRSRRSAMIFVAFAIMNLCIFVPEMVLRVADFHHQSGIQFGFPRPSDFISFLPDERLFWKLDPARDDINSMGFRDDEVPVPKPDGTFRILFIGDSCTEQGYPDYVEAALAREHGVDHVETVKLAVSGYSSHQGRQLADMYGESLEADMAVVYYGWNDHWLAFGAIDSEKVVRVKESALNELFAPAYNYVRLTQAIAWVLSAPAGDRGEPIRAVRVPIDRYRENLSHIREVFVKQDIPVILLTAPTSFYRLGVPDQLIKLMFGRDKDEIAALHRQYNEIVRGIDRVNTIDLEAEFDALSTEDMLEMFSTDGIHFTQIGLSRLGDRVAAAIAERTSFVPRR